MKIHDLRVNRLENPLGYDFSFLTMYWQISEAKGRFSREMRLKIWKEGQPELPCFDTGVLKDFHKCMYGVNLKPEPGTRYFWQVWARDETGDEAQSDTAFFETGKGAETWSGRWIGVKEDADRMPVLYRDFTLTGETASARLYIYGVGLYEVYVNGHRAGDEYLQPGYHSYDLRMEYQTYDLTGELRTGGNRLCVVLGEGWYKGRFGFDGDFKNLYGDRKKCIAELHVRYPDGRRERVVTDRSWKGMQSHILHNGIYDGEWIDDTLPCRALAVEELEESTRLLTERTGPPIHKTEHFLPVRETEHPDGYLLLDFGEAVTGWVEWDGALSRGQTIRLQYGEVLQYGGFYNENLRTAKAEFVYRSDGREKTVRPHFTWYGFRYVKVEGLKKGQRPVFRAYRLMSDIRKSGRIDTSNEKVNRLVENTLRSQKCNFLDIPTDCPQRDERMGWTGDVAIFAPSACFHMDCGAFFRHYAKSLSMEQQLMGGNIPFFAPRMKLAPGEGVNPFYYTGGACGWGDVATVLPFTLYRYYGDLQLLREQYPMMCGWVDYLTEETKKNPTPYLRQNGRQLGDWLALDNGEPDNPTGRTNVHMLASAYYYYSASLCAQAAMELLEERAEEFCALAQNIRKAFLAFYYDPEGTLRAEPTQTACAFLLTLRLYPEKGKDGLVRMLKELLTANGGLLDTGFLGTPVLCKALSDNGQNGMAYALLLNEKYPGWLHEVNLGATTVWERWNSLNGDGTVSGTGMNSLNHYAYGSIADWMYEFMCGFRPCMYKDPCMTISPMPDRRLQWVRGVWESVYGTFVCGWAYDGAGALTYRLEIPFNAKARVIFPGGRDCLLSAGKYLFDGKGEPL